MTGAARPSLVLASTSPYRRQLLERLGLPFNCIAPGVEEGRLGEEPAVQMAARLARAKAESVRTAGSAGIVIGSDQVAVRGEELLGKPGDAERCRRQLAESSGREILFLTAVCVVSDGGSQRLEHVDRTIVRFRELDIAEIARYVEHDRPWDCAGGFRCESLGIGLFERIETVDPTALIGLPLIWLAGALRRCGLWVP